MTNMGCAFKKAAQAASCDGVTITHPLVFQSLCHIVSAHSIRHDLNACKHFSLRESMCCMMKQENKT